MSLRPCPKCRCSPCVCREPKAAWLRENAAESQSKGPLKFTLPYPPSANRYWRHVGRKVLVSEEARLYRDEVALATRQLRPMAGQVRVRLDVYRPQKRGDLDNTAKVLLDSLKGIAFTDDSQIVELHMTRNDDKDDPRVVVLIHPAHSQTGAEQ